MNYDSASSHYLMDFRLCGNDLQLCFYYRVNEINGLFETAEFDSGQGRSISETAGVGYAYDFGFHKYENAVLDQNMLFPNRK